jgi:hypothetical protein
VSLTSHAAVRRCLLTYSADNDRIDQGVAGGGKSGTENWDVGIVTSTGRPSVAPVSKNARSCCMTSG